MVKLILALCHSPPAPPPTSSTKHDQCLQFPDVTRSGDHLHRPAVCSVSGTSAGGQSVDRDSDHHPGPGGGRTRRFCEREQRRRTQAQWGHHRYTRDFLINLPYMSFIITFLQGNYFHCTVVRIKYFVAHQILTFKWRSWEHWFWHMIYDVSDLTCFVIPSNNIIFKIKSYVLWPAGDLLIIMAQIIVSVQMVLEEKFIYKHNVHPLKAVGTEGKVSERNRILPDVVLL